MWFLRPSIVIAVTLVVAASMSAQTDCRQRAVPVTVFDRKSGQLIESSVASFKASYRGKPARLTSVTSNNKAPRVLALLDVSGSMAIDPYMAFRLTPSVPPAPPSGSETGSAIVADMVSMLPQDSEVGFLTFAEKVEAVVSLTSNRKQVMDAVELLHQRLTNIRKDPQSRPTSRTAIWDALNESMGMLGSPQFGDTVYLISDAVDNRSKANAQRITARLESAGIRVFLVHTKQVSEDVWKANTSLRWLQDAVRNTGGSMVSFETPLTLSSLPAVRERLALQYRLVANLQSVNVELPVIVRQSADWRLELSDTPGKNAFEIAYPRRLPACN